MGGGGLHSPIAREVLTNKLFTDIAAKHHCSVGVVSLSWAVQRGIIVIPKSSSRERIDTNIRLVTLTDEEMNAINNAQHTIGKFRIADHIKFMQREFRGKKTLMGWTPEDFGWEDSQGNWLT